MPDATVPDASARLAALTGPGGPFEIVVEDVRGVPTQVYKNRMPHLRAMLDVAAASHAGKTALVQGEQRLTFAQTLDRIHSVAASLVDRGVGKGDRVAILAANSPDWVVAFWATLAIGAVAVPLNAWWKADELEFVLADSGAQVVICDERRHQVIEDLPPALPALRHRVVLADAAAGDADPFEALATERQDAPMPDVPIDEDDAACILYTSGTTGRPKGSIQTHRGTIANFQNLAARTALLLMATSPSSSRDEASPPGQRPGRADQTAWLLIVPLFHVTGLFTTCVPAMVAGGKIVFMPPGRFDADVAMQAIEAEQVTILSGVPTIMWRILQSPNLGTWDLRTLTTVSYGGAPSSAELTRRLAEHFPWLAGGGPSTAYGLTETAGVVTANAGDDYLRKPTSVGPPVPTVEVRIVGADGDEVACGDRGEIWVKGPIVSPGYWRRPEANAETFTDGWLHTGDIGKVDEEGFVHILDRAKDMIIRAGENIYCAEIEDVLFTHPKIVDAAVIGVPDDDLGERVKAVLVLREGEEASAEEIITFTADRLAHYKVPELVDFHAGALPRNPAGKVLKQALRGESTAFGLDEGVF